MNSIAPFIEDPTPHVKVGIDGVCAPGENGRMPAPLELIEEFPAPHGTLTFWRTGDGSPTLSHGTSSAPGECMHHSDGALSETLYIYGSAAEHVMREKWSPRFLVVGLGLGLIEMTLAALWERDQNEDSELRITSYESDEMLRECFGRWIEGRDTDVPAPFSRAYNQVSEALSETFSLPGRARSIRERLRDWLNSDRLILNGKLEAESPLPRLPVSALLFDAYSRATSPDLWDEGFLKDFLARTAASPSLLATYAAQGNLKRALGTAGFVLQPRAGFSGKRESTFAIKA